MTKLRQTEMKFGGNPLSSAETDSLIHRGTGSLRNSRNQDTCHIAFGSRVLGPPPLSGRRNNVRVSSETVRSVGPKSHRSCQRSTVDKCVTNSEKSPSLIPDCVEQGDKENICQIRHPVPFHASLPIMHPHPPQEPSADKNNNRRRFRLKGTSRERTDTPSGSSSGNHKNEEDKATTVLATVAQEDTEVVNSSTPGPQSSDQADEWIFPECDDHIPHLTSSKQSPLLYDDSCNTSHLWLQASNESDHDCEVEGTQIIQEDIFTFSSRPRSAPHGKTPDMSPEGGAFILDPKEDNSVTSRDTRLEDDFYGMDSSEEGYTSLQGSPGSTTSPSGLTQLTLENTLGSSAGWTRRGCPEALGSQDSLVKQEDRNDLQRSLLPAPCLSPPRRSCGSSQKTLDPLIKAEALPAHQVPTSLNKTSLKEITAEKLKPIPEVSEYDWRNYQPSQMSESELQMLASLRRQQNEELEDAGTSHGLSASQVDNCNVSISTSSDDTTTWNSCLPPPVNQGRHYQKEMNPPSPSNPRDWLNMLSPPIVPPSQQSAGQHLDSSGSLSAQGEEDLSVDEDEEVLTLLYDPCLNCYFDPQTGKYYELV
ncbi:protein CFAP20DC isoform X2 [Lepus europaeus]|uniref:protein CFAP20DC isoform X2 n=1 Tax=Lepus europaeus TaxID=9983 RepID=UPI002B4A1EDD|nr:protein CFAP20DC isoform X2 [Lepus europaeus]